jgi:hypothetical protein
VTGLGTPAQPSMLMGIREMKLCMKPVRRRSCFRDSLLPSHPVGNLLVLVFVNLSSESQFKPTMVFLLCIFIP